MDKAHPWFWRCGAGCAPHPALPYAVGEGSKQSPGVATGRGKGENDKSLPIYGRFGEQSFCTTLFPAHLETRVEGSTRRSGG